MDPDVSKCSCDGANMLIFGEEQLLLDLDLGKLLCLSVEQNGDLEYDHHHHKLLEH